MEQKKAYNKALIHILCCFILLVIFVISITRVEAKGIDSLLETSNTEDVVPLKPYSAINLFKRRRVTLIENKFIKYDKPRIVEKNINYYIETEIDTLTFFAKAFGYDIEFVKEDLIKRAKDIKEIEPTNIGSLKDKDNNLLKYDSVEYGIVEYYYELISSYPEKQNKEVVTYEGNNTYVENLIMYYTNIYKDVDRTLALSIGAAESGYYKVKYMLRMNNVYGGMSRSGLIKYNNIEIGVLKYIRLLNDGYFKKGLTTPESIGRVYCPTYNENGVKIASPHWINLVNNAKNKYKNYTQDITISDLMNI